MNAASCGFHNMIDLLLDVRANPNLQDKDGSTALMYAAEHGHGRCVKSLMKHKKCDPTIKDKVWTKNDFRFLILPIVLYPSFSYLDFLYKTRKTVIKKMNNWICGCKNYISPLFFVANGVLESRLTCVDENGIDLFIGYYSELSFIVKTTLVNDNTKIYSMVNNRTRRKWNRTRWGIWLCAVPTSVKYKW